MRITKDDIAAALDAFVNDWGLHNVLGERPIYLGVSPGGQVWVESVLDDAPPGRVLARTSTPPHYGLGDLPVVQELSPGDPDEEAILRDFLGSPESADLPADVRDALAQRGVSGIVQVYEGGDGDYDWALKEVAWHVVQTYSDRVMWDAVAREEFVEHLWEVLQEAEMAGGEDDELGG